MRLHAVAAAILGWSAPLLGQTTWYVDAAAAPGGNGSSGAPFASIQAGINAAANGDTVLVAPGSYAPVAINAKDINLRSTSGAAATLISTGAGTRMTITSTTSACAIDGFTLAGGQGTNAGCSIGSTPGGLLVVNASPVVRNCIVRNNTGGHGTLCPFPLSGLAGAPGGIGIGGSSSPVIENCVIRWNVGGAGVWYYDGIQYYSGPPGAGGINNSSSGTVVRHCTIWGNVGGSGSNPLSAGRGGFSGVGAVVNTIVYANYPGNGGPPPMQPEIGGFFGVGLSVTWCDVALGYPGVGNFDADPVFVDPGNGDLRLADGSPCVDAGSPAGTTSDHDGVARPQYLQVDVGAYEWRPPSALTLSIAQPAGPASVDIVLLGGSGGEVYVSLFTTDGVNGGPFAGQGPWGGLFMTTAEVVSQIGLGVPPFYGVLNAAGSASTAVPLPQGLSGAVTYCVSHTLGAVHVSRRSPVITYVLL